MMFKTLTPFFLTCAISLFADTWTPSAAIDAHASVRDDVFLAATNEQAFAAWMDSDTQAPTYSIYSNGSWSPAAAIDANTAVGELNVYLAYDSSSGNMFAAWT